MTAQEIYDILNTQFFHNSLTAEISYLEGLPQLVALDIYEDYFELVIATMATEENILSWIAPLYERMCFLSRYQEDKDIDALKVLNVNKDLPEVLEVLESHGVKIPDVPYLVFIICETIDDTLLFNYFTDPEAIEAAREFQEALDMDMLGEDLPIKKYSVKHGIVLRSSLMYMAIQEKYEPQESPEVTDDLINLLDMFTSGYDITQETELLERLNPFEDQDGN
jgi:hypothetical protein